jgi:hypothetical protein
VNRAGVREQLVLASANLLLWHFPPPLLLYYAVLSLFLYLCSSVLWKYRCWTWRDTPWLVIACIACVVLALHCIRLIPVAVLVRTVAEVVLVAVELSQAVVLRLVL